MTSMITGLRILVVEDEPLVAMMIEDMLAEMGHVIARVASRLEDGLDAAAGGEFDAAVLDVNLGGESSFEIAERLRDRAIPFVFATGYGSAGVLDRFSGTPVLHKPFRDDELARALERVAIPK